MMKCGSTHRVLEGEDAESVAIDQGVCDVGGTVRLTSSDYPTFRDAINNAPPLDLAIAAVEDLTCERTADGILVTGRIPGAAAGEEVFVRASISGDEFIDLGEQAATVGDDGRFEMEVPKDGDETHVSVTARRGVYTAGGQFFDDCE